MGTPKEIAPGIFHWTAVHPEIGIRVHSYYWSLGRVLLDPLLPAPAHHPHEPTALAAQRETGRRIPVHGLGEPERTPPPRPSAEGTALRSRRHAAQRHSRC